MSNNQTASLQRTREGLSDPKTPARPALSNKSNSLNRAMPPKKSGTPASSSGSGKQLSLLGFFSKASGPAPSAGASNTAAFQNAQPRKDGSSSAAKNKTLAPKEKAAALAAGTEALQTPPPTTDRTKGSSSGAASAIMRNEPPEDTERVSSPPMSSPTIGRQLKPTTSRPSAPMPASKSSVSIPMEIDDEDDEVISAPKRRTTAKRAINYIESDDDEQDASDAETYKPLKRAGPAKKKARSSKSSSFADDDEAFIVADDESISEAASIVAISDDDDDAAKESEEEEPAPKRPAPRKKASGSSAPSRPAMSSSPSVPSLNAFAAMSAPRPGSMQKSSSMSHLTQAERRVEMEKRKKAANEEAYSFLVDLRDKDGNRPGDEEYDPRTVYIPKSAWAGFTPFERQFWEIKQNHWDTVLFFQKGKFYELYEEDALIGHREFDLKLTDRTKMKMVGVPEHSFDMFAAKFLGLGYKVGRVDQMETAVAKGMRTGEKSRGGGGEIVRRELSHVFTTGTIVNTSALPDDMSSYCLSIKEVVSSDSALSQPSFGICTLDAATAEFSLTAFEDDASRTKLETLLRSIRLREVLYEKGQLSKTTLRLLKNTIPSTCQITQLKSGAEFLDREDTIQKLNELFGQQRDEGEEEEALKVETLPEAIRSMIDEENAISALGAMLWYLTQLNLDKDLCASRNFNIFDPLRKRQCLILDAQSLSHLNVLQNDRGDEEGTLHQLLNRCITPFGKRLFKIWLVSPLSDAKAINARLDAVDDFLRDTAFEDSFGAFARKLPDIERIMPRIHAGKAKPRDFTNVLNAFARFSRAIQNLSEIAQDFETSTIRDLLERIPDVTAKADELKSTFEVQEDGSFIPRRGHHEDFDDADDNLDRIERALHSALDQHARSLNLKVGKTIKFKDVGTKEIYQVEVAKKTVVPKSWASVSSTKNESRYYPEDIRDLVQELKEGRETRLAALKDFMQVTYAAFREESRVYTAAIKAVAEIDCLLSLAKASYAMGEPTCRPEFIESDAAEIEFKELRHPCMANARASEFIPNDIALGGDQDEMIILTGGNMAGKSTTARTAATAVIIAQMGCRVPAASARLAPVDRIASRMGANDQLFKNNSTFMVEMLEASRIISECTPRSLVIMDELGRGTSTFDGQAIAYAVLHHLVGRTRCLGFFLTHYTNLAHDFSSYPRVCNKHMEVLVDDKVREVIFTYRLVPGIAESSFGTQVAALAGVPHEVCDRAEAVSKEFMLNVKQQQAARSVSKIPVSALSDVSYLFKLAERDTDPADEEALLLSRQLSIMKAQIDTQNEGREATRGDEDIEMRNVAEPIKRAARPQISYGGRNKRRRMQEASEDEKCDKESYFDSKRMGATLERPSTTATSGRTSVKATKPPLEQLILDFGQKTVVVCKTCQMSYDRSSTSDRTLHQKHHDDILKGPEWTNPTLLQAGTSVQNSADGPQDVRFLAYSLEDNGQSSWPKKLHSFIEVVDQALGALPLPDDVLRRCKVFLALLRGRAVGLAVVGRVRPGSARRVADKSSEGDGPVSPTEDAIVAGDLIPDSELPPIGLHRIYVVPEKRRTGIASALLDCVVEHAVYGQSSAALIAAYGGQSGVLAFSQPTESGARLARRWLGKSSEQSKLIVFED
ncbi:DNA mismatch repair protein msh6 [Tilletia horrida]|nr:DNA mismatch repair protein msh6 [Tilletia horrida]